MNTVEEFTFPIINNNTASNKAVDLSTAVLPPLWRIPSINNEGGAVHGRRITKILTTFVSSSHELPQAQGEIIINYNYSGDQYAFNNNNNNNNNNNSAAEKVEDENNIVVAAKSEEAAAAELEKMDVLWEDFNEELLLQSCSGSSISESHIDHHLHSNNNYYYTYGGELFDKRNESVEKSTKRRNNLELVFKMFKKVFLLPNNNIAATTVKKTGHIS